MLVGGDGANARLASWRRLVSQCLLKRPTGSSELSRESSSFWSSSWWSSSSSPPPPSTHLFICDSLPPSQRGGSGRIMSGSISVPAGSLSRLQCGASRCRASLPVTCRCQAANKAIDCCRLSIENSPSPPVVGAFHSLSLLFPLCQPGRHANYYYYYRRRRRWRSRARYYYVSRSGRSSVVNLAGVVGASRRWRRRRRVNNR